ncbi:MAG TPA: amidohydrolase family protein, partial [Thermoanaerobaculia bacterium]
KNPVSERFEATTDKAFWKSAAEAGGRDFDSHSFYTSLNASPLEVGLLARALLDNRRRRLDVLPDGEARIEKVGAAQAKAAGIARPVDLYAVAGLGFSPAYVWLDGQRNVFAVVSGWGALVLEGWEPAVPDLVKAQDAVNAARLKGLYKEVARRPERVLIRNVKLFDPESGKSRPNTSVLTFRNRIEKVGNDREIEIPDSAEVIEGKGRTLLPGLWDMHVHLGPDDGALDIAAGVTTVRDMANDTDQLLEMKRGFDASEMVGPHILMAGFIDGPGPYAGPSKVLVDTEEKAIAAVDRYAQLGYVQVKLYSSLDPKLVPPIVERAKKYHLRVSGHIPNGLTAEQAVRAGFNEIQHVNFLFLNFQDGVDTRTPARFSEVAEHAAELDLQSDKVREFIALLKERGTAVDPTLNAFEGMFLSRTGTLDPSLAPVANRLPLQVRRGLFGGGIVKAGKEETYRKSYAALLAMVRALYDAGIPIEAGTDSLAGFNLHRELELYVQAGIPAPQVLRIATLGAAKI